MDTPSDARLTSNAAGAERRRTPRVDVRITMSGQASSSRVRLANVNEGGCLVYASCLLNVGDTHLLRFTTDSGDDVMIRTRVVHIAKMSGDPDTACLAGLEFFGDDSERQQQAIVQLLTLPSASRL